MATMTESPHRTPNMPGSGHHHQHHLQHHGHHIPHDEAMGSIGPGSRIVPIPTPSIQTSAPSPGEPMDIATPTSATLPLPARKSPEPNGGEQSKASSPSGGSVTDNTTQNQATMAAPPAAAAAAVSQPKIVQTAFIHKLYNMLEDQSIQHLISWTQSGESFVMSPSQDFSKVLAQYFKHTNISSFVRQLNMYGFHKVSDVFHTTSPESSLWEFKHGSGNFRRGDVASLREIKRRASRHALVHREYNSQKPNPSQPGTPAEPMPMPPHPATLDTTEARLANIEHTIYDLNARLARSEENAHYINVKNHALMESTGHLLRFTQDICRNMTSMAGPDNPVYRDILQLQGEIQRHTDMFRPLEDPQEPPFSGTRQFFQNIENPPVSPRQLAQDDPRRSTLAVPQPRGPSGNYYKPPIPSNLSISTRRPYGSIGGNSQVSPLRNTVPPPPPTYPITIAEPPSNLPRRHTSADIRAHWQQSATSPFGQASSQTGGQWPPSPNRAPPLPEDQRIRESLSTYSLQTASQPRSRPTTPTLPPFSNGASGDTFGGWSWNAAIRSDGKGLGLRDGSAPSTRRGSMAHILNPSDTAERDDEDDDPRGEEDRKRKRLG